MAPPTLKLVAASADDFESFSNNLNINHKTKKPKRSSDFVLSGKISENLITESMKCDLVHRIEKGSATENAGKMDVDLSRTDSGSSKTKTKDSDNVNASPEYPANFNGHFFVLVDASECKSMNSDKIRNGFALRSQIKDINFMDVDLILAVGRTLFKVTFKSAEAANRFLKNDELKKRGLRPFIPNTAFETYGVVRGIPLEYNVEDIKRNAISSIPISSVHRFTRRERNENEDVFVPTTTVKIGFLGKEIPKNIKFDYTRLEVNFFIPPLRQCRKCGRLGHTQLACKANATHPRRRPSQHMRVSYMITEDHFSKFFTRMLPYNKTVQGLAYTTFPMI
ncbi:PREDICTED: uncharacterized protein LOC108366845 [Rhagoletis zephyria]|uniref:uncharacterized protein LOC108366845 n=1 Tax=Rhagoletis zephyria TaxID=28612 RepID=UPI0008115C6F|nr:PREDICTED: uncharacterized protein LOC108366845 [Rhagoletis zephyria]